MTAITTQLVHQLSFSAPMVNPAQTLDTWAEVLRKDFEERNRKLTVTPDMHDIDDQVKQLNTAVLGLQRDCTCLRDDMAEFQTQTSAAFKQILDRLPPRPEQSNLARAFGHLGSMFGSPRVPRNLAQVTAQSEQVAPAAAATALPPPPQPARAPAAHGASATAATNAATTDDATAAANAATTVAAATGGSGTVADPAGSPAGAADTAAAAAAATRNLPAQAVLPYHVGWYLR